MKQKPKIAISNELKAKLDKLKQYPRETYEDVIRRLLK
jgi:predicted CopG family antitoxin